MTANVKRAIWFGVCCYFGATLVVVFNTPDVSFFALSIIFLTGNFICVLELFSRNEDAALVDPTEFFGREFCGNLVLEAMIAFRRSAAPAAGTWLDGGQ